MVELQNVVVSPVYIGDRLLQYQTGDDEIRENFDFEYQTRHSMTHILYRYPVQL